MPTWKTTQPLRLRRLVAFALALFLWGCAADEPLPSVEGGGGQGGGGLGGSPGGSGGAGGMGGAGGAGGSGGTTSEPRCGDGEVDEGEECDLGLGNGELSACSADCKLQGSCAAPIDWAAVASPSTDGGGLIDIPETTFRGHAAHGPPGNCNSAGDQLVFHYTPPQDGVLFVGFQNGVTTPQGGPVLIARTACGDPESQLPGLCVPHRGGIVSKVEVEGGVPLYFVVDSHEAAKSGWWFAVATGLFPFKGENEVCAGHGVDPDRNRCVAGLFCDAGGTDRCIENDPPVLHDAVVYRGGFRDEEIVVAVEAEGGTIALQAIGGTFLDELGAPVPGREGHDPAESPITMGFLSGLEAPLDELHRRAGFFHEWPGLDGAVEVEVSVMNRGGARSEPLRRDILDLPVALEGEACDPDEVFTRCTEEAYCTEEGVCEALAPIRQLLCEEAPAIAPGEELAFSASDSDLPPRWRIHESCSLASWSDYPRLNPGTQLARLHLSEGGPLRIEAEGIVTRPVLMLYPGCGIGGAPLACAHPEGISTDSVLEFEDLDAGDYLIVVKPNEVRNHAVWTLRVSEAGN